MKVRGSGILLHISSLPSRCGIGDCGPAAFSFVDFLTKTHQNYWQVLPLNPVDPICGNSPYSSSSAFAGNILFLSPERLCEDGFIKQDSMEPLFGLPQDYCDFDAVIRLKKAIFEEAYLTFSKKKKQDKALFNAFCRAASWWLDDYALFVVIKNHVCEKVWTEWPDGLKFRETGAIAEVRNTYAREIEKEQFLQFMFVEQWNRLREYCARRGIQLIGDIPIYVRFDSADVWAHPDIFKLDKERRQTVVAGVPPDYFSSSGQLWGNPVYNWDLLCQQNYDWWVRRVQRNLDLYDVLRIDHFRGFVACWEVPAGESTAINGTWVKAPARDFFNALFKHFPNLPVIAEDLGIITPDVREELWHFDIPGMKVLLFAFYEEEPQHQYLPHMYSENCLVYPGTHDNNTIKGWYCNETDEQAKYRINRYFAKEVTCDSVHWDMIRLAMQSVANMVIIAMQDVLGLGEEARMNKPSVSFGNWSWRLTPEAITEAIKSHLAELTYVYGRK
jgi:4-alpha-glucanotransferase